MKRNTHLFRSVFAVCGLLCLFLMFQSCREDLTGTLPVIEEELVGEYLSNNPALFSEFSRMLDTTGVMGLLNAYGMYTVFAPTNEAIQRYYRTLKDENGDYTVTSLNQLPLSQIKDFCYNHIIKGDTLKTKTFKEGALGAQSMSERFLTVSFVDTAIIINGQSPIVMRDIEMHNGIIHVLEEALSPAHIKLGECFEADSARFSIYIDALKATGLYMLMNIARIEDEGYNYKLGAIPKTTDAYNPEIKPVSRKFGYTILAVSDEDLANYITPGSPTGVHSLADLDALARYYYSREYNNDATAITDKTDRKNYLNRFMSYHCFDRIILSSRFIKDLFTPHHFPQFAMRDYIETMLENSIIETLIDKPGVVLSPAMAADPRSAFGVFNYDDPIQGAMLTNIKDLPNGGSMNGYYHGINKPIMYSKTLANALSSKRLRIDGSSFFPELTTNNMRGSNPTASGDKRPRCWAIDNSYLEGYECTPNTLLSYIGACEYWENYQGDMFMVFGSYNFTMKTCPIPAGTYEVRFAFKSTQNRGIAQLYLDSLPCGIPLDLAIDAANASIGSVTPGSNAEDPNGYENDKMMHNRGYMKGSTTYRATNTTYWNNASARISNLCIRRVLGTYTFDKTEKHYFTAISLGSSNSNPVEFMLDYLEFCPIELIDSEDIE